jgi:type II secretory pathway pseudopilin PulG
MSLVEVLVAVAIFALIAGAVYGVYTRSQRTQLETLSAADAQQNARLAMEVISTELKMAGSGVNIESVPPIEVASEYRLTFNVDLNGNHALDLGEKVTYFIDFDKNDQVAASTANPNDMVLRRVVSSVSNPTAHPSPGEGEILAYAVTQQADDDLPLEVPLFRYFDENGSDLVDGSSPVDPDSGVYGFTVVDSLLGKPVGAGKPLEIATVGLRIVVESSAINQSTSRYDRLALDTDIHPRTLKFLSGLMDIQTFSPFYPDSLGGGAPPDTGGGAPPDSGAPPDTGGIPLPEYEPPIRISTERVLSLTLVETNELDSNEGSYTVMDDQHDLDIIVGTKAGGSNNLNVWWNGQPGRYDDNRLFQNDPSYVGCSIYDQLSLASGELNDSVSTFTDVVSATRANDTQGAMQSWINQEDIGLRGVVGQSWAPIEASGTYIDGGPPVTGQGRAVTLADLDADGDLDVVLGTRTGNYAGKFETWFNSGLGLFSHVPGSDTYDVSGEVYSITTLDANSDGFTDIAVSVATSKFNGGFEIWLNSAATPGVFSFAHCYTCSGEGRTIAAGDMNYDGVTDIVAGTRTGNKKGRVEYWENQSGSFARLDYVNADGPVLCVALGYLDYGNSSLDIAAGTAQKTVQAWFCDQHAPGGDVIPENESWADAATGGEVNGIAIGKLECSQDNPHTDPLNDIVIGTAKNDSEGEIIIYLNPYVSLLP